MNTACTTSSGAILVDCSGQVYDARTTSDKLPSDFRGTLPDGWTMLADITDRNGEECISVEFKDPKTGTQYAKPMEKIGIPNNPQLLTFWGVKADNYADYPTFIVSIGNDANNAKTYVFSPYVAEGKDRPSLFSWTTQGPVQKNPETLEYIAGQATDFDGTTLTVGGKQYELAKDLTIIQQ
ncbi:hypothetical protein [Bifidobacterium dolichotidis]|uniref:hypothetical protein n=1 Tax=Bifidobacterium dolichotidis TaxID=2306976 RepID=UPI000F7E5D4B|nr:hypothetical protein [Bifidobacterium dolichotidis]